MTAPVAVLGLGTAVPEHRLPQSEARGFARGFFADDFGALERLLLAFANAGIDERQLARPLDWYGAARGFPEKNEVWAEVALGLAVQAGERALVASGVARGTLRAVVLATSTGIATPSLDAHLVQRLDLPRSIARTPLWGLGCAGGAAGLARAAALARGLGGPVLLVATEVCSATFVHEDRSKSNLIATALFGDGAAACVVGEGEGPELLGAHSELIDDSFDVMGWALRPSGLEVRFARSIPALVAELAPRFAREAAAAVGLEREALGHFVFHPGGAKVLAAYRRALDLDESAVAPARAVLAAHGNMSSPTVLFVLERFLAETPPSGRPGLLLGLGPGFSAEGVVFRW